MQANTKSARIFAAHHFSTEIDGRHVGKMFEKLNKYSRVKDNNIWTNNIYFKIF